MSSHSNGNSSNGFFDQAENLRRGNFEDITGSVNNDSVLAFTAHPIGEENLDWYRGLHDDSYRYPHYMTAVERHRRTRPDADRYNYLSSVVEGGNSSRSLNSFNRSIQNRTALPNSEHFLEAFRGRLDHINNLERENFLPDNDEGTSYLRNLRFRERSPLRNSQAPISSNIPEYSHREHVPLEPYYRGDRGAVHSPRYPRYLRDVISQRFGFPESQLNRRVPPIQNPIQQADTRGFRY